MPVSTIHYPLSTIHYPLSTTPVRWYSNSRFPSYYDVKLRNIKKNSLDSIQLRIIFTESFVLLKIFNKTFGHLHNITQTCLEY
jgi:hypothetical protein